MSLIILRSRLHVILNNSLKQQMEICVCGFHEIHHKILPTVQSSELSHLQHHFLISTIPKRPCTAFCVRIEDPDISPNNTCLDMALDALYYWLHNSALRDHLAILVVDHDVLSELDISFLKFAQALEQKNFNSENIVSRLSTFLSENHFPEVVLKAMVEYDNEEVYGLFDGFNPNAIIINSALIKKSEYDENHYSTLQITFLLFGKCLHEYAHFLAFYTMKNENAQLITPDELLGESGEFVEMAMFGDTIYHHSQSALCRWFVELLITGSSKAGTTEATYFTIDFMKSFFDKATVDNCKDLKQLRKKSYTKTIKHASLSILRPRVSTNDEVSRFPESHSHLATVKIPENKLNVFIPRKCHSVKK
eukprot:NODE_19_length_47148_cov_1.447810.p11 type:complete len:364 gc:universal NODE_19_length_47148_cov_1.447810:17518-16427(-)